eukprot:706601-Rhodomonas_salina.1
MKDLVSSNVCAFDPTSRRGKPQGNTLLQDVLRCRTDVCADMAERMRCKTRGAPARCFSLPQRHKRLSVHTASGWRETRERKERSENCAGERAVEAKNGDEQTS